MMRLIDLVTRDEFGRIFQIDLVANEDFMKIPIQFAFLDHVLQDLERFSQGLARFVGSGPGGQRFEYVRQAKNPRLHTEFGGSETLGIAGSVDALVVRARDLDAAWRIELKGDSGFYGSDARGQITSRFIRRNTEKIVTTLIGDSISFASRKPLWLVEERLVEKPDPDLVADRPHQAYSALEGARGQQ